MVCAHHRDGIEEDCHDDGRRDNGTHRVSDIRRIVEDMIGHERNQRRPEAESEEDVVESYGGGDKAAAFLRRGRRPEHADRDAENAAHGYDQQQRKSGTYSPTRRHSIADEATRGRADDTGQDNHRAEASADLPGRPTEAPHQQGGGPGEQGIVDDAPGGQRPIERYEDCGVTTESAPNLAELQEARTQAAG